VSEEENQRAKEEMNAVFVTKQLKPGDEGYVWDKQVEFEAPVEGNDWDEEDD